MRVVLDTNTLVSGVISAGGPPRRLLDDARAQVFELCSSATLLAELLDVLAREKFSARLAQAGLSPQDIVMELRRLAHVVAPAQVPRVIAADADDDHVLACAVSAQAELIVSETNIWSVWADSIRAFPSFGLQRQSVSSSEFEAHAA